MRIGNIKLKNRLILAPMAGITDMPFRVLAKRMGCALVCSEMISDKGLLYQNAHTMKMLQLEPAERPAAIQIFGSDAPSMREAAKMVEQAGADIIDINMGCPTPKIVKNGEGAALMKNPALAFDIMASVVGAVKVPVTVKMRKGWDAKNINALEIAKLAEQAGVAAVSVHGRTRDEFYSGKADWGIVKKIKETVQIPVILSGDIISPATAQAALVETGCDGLMIGRAARGNPWIFKNILHYFATGIILPEPRLAERAQMLLTHLEMLIEHKGEYIAVREMRSHAGWYTKGLPNSAALRLAINCAKNKDDFLVIIEDYRDRKGSE